MAAEERAGVLWGQCNSLIACVFACRGTDGLADGCFGEWIAKVGRVIPSKPRKRLCG